MKKRIMSVIMALALALSNFSGAGLVSHVHAVDDIIESDGAVVNIDPGEVTQGNNGTEMYIPLGDNLPAGTVVKLNLVGNTDEPFRGYFANDETGFHNLTGGSSILVEPGEDGSFDYTETYTLEPPSDGDDYATRIILKRTSDHYGEKISVTFTKITYEVVGFEDVEALPVLPYEEQFVYETFGSYKSGAEYDAETGTVTFSQTGGEIGWAYNDGDVYNGYESVTVFFGNGGASVNGQIKVVEQNGPLSTYDFNKGDESITVDLVPYVWYTKITVLCTDDVTEPVDLVIRNTEINKESVDGITEYSYEFTSTHGWNTVIWKNNQYELRKFMSAISKPGAVIEVDYDVPMSPDEGDGYIIVVMQRTSGEWDLVGTSLVVNNKDCVGNRSGSAIIEAFDSGNFDAGDYSLIVNSCNINLEDVEVNFKVKVYVPERNYENVVAQGTEVIEVPSGDGEWWYGTSTLDFEGWGSLIKWRPDSEGNSYPAYKDSYVFELTCYDANFFVQTYGAIDDSFSQYQQVAGVITMTGEQMNANWISVIMNSGAGTYNVDWVVYDTDDEQSGDHEHVFTYALPYGNHHHHRICDICGHTVRELHSFDENDICVICKAEKPDHDLVEDYRAFSETKHWRHCAICNYLFPEEHTFMDGYCTVCGYEQNGVHDYSVRVSECLRHYKICNNCKYVFEEPHIYDDNYVCTVCGIQLHDVVFEELDSYHDNYHHYYTCDHDYYTNDELHIFDDTNTCTVCGYVTEAICITGGTHNYEYIYVDEVYHYAQCQGCYSRFNDRSHRFINNICIDCGAEATGDYRYEQEEPGDGHEHSFYYVYNDDNDVTHYKYCSTCYEYFGEEPHEFTFGMCKICNYNDHNIDLSSINFIDLIGKPIDDVVAQFVEWFGEDSVTKGTLSDVAYIVNAFDAFEFEITSKRGMVYGILSRMISSRVANLPQVAEGLSYDITCADLEKLIETGIYDVKVTEMNQKSFTGLDGAKRISVYFFVGDVAVLYNYNNYISYYNSETGKTDARLRSEEEMNMYSDIADIVLNDRDYSNVNLADVIGMTKDQAMVQLSEWFGADNVSLGEPQSPRADVTESILVNIEYLGQNYGFPRYNYFDIQCGIVVDMNGAIPNIDTVNMPNTIDGFPLVMTVSDLLENIENSGYEFRLTTYPMSFTGLDGAMNYSYTVYSGKARIQYSYQNYATVYNPDTSEWTYVLYTEEEMMNSTAYGNLSISEDYPVGKEWPLTPYSDTYLFGKLLIDDESIPENLNELIDDYKTINVRVKLEGAIVDGKVLTVNDLLALEDLQLSFGGFIQGTKDGKTESWSRQGTSGSELSKSGLAYGDHYIDSVAFPHDTDGWTDITLGIRASFYVGPFFDGTNPYEGAKSITLIYSDVTVSVVERVPCEHVNAHATLCYYDRVTHNIVCDDCGKVLERGIAHKATTAKDNGDGTHTGTCDDCGTSVTAEHEYSEEGKCNSCGFDKYDIPDGYEDTPALDLTDAEFEDDYLTVTSEAEAEGADEEIEPVNTESVLVVFADGGAKQSGTVVVTYKNKSRIRTLAANNGDSVVVEYNVSDAYVIIETDPDKEIESIVIGPLASKDEVDFIHVKPLNEFALGDINGDGKVDVQDGVLMQRILAKLETNKVYLARADLNGDGDVSVQDGVKMQRILAKLE